MNSRTGPPTRRRSTTATRISPQMGAGPLRGVAGMRYMVDSHLASNPQSFSMNCRRRQVIGSLLMEFCPSFTNSHFNIEDISLSDSRTERKLMKPQSSLRGKQVQITLLHRNTLLHLFQRYTYLG